MRRQAGPALEISKETTFIEGPLNDEGRVDIRRHLNALRCKGVVPKENAAIPLIAILCADEWTPEERKQIVVSLGENPFEMNLPRFSGPYAEQGLTDDYFAALESREKGPLEATTLLRDWIEKNSDGIDACFKAIHLDAFFAPLIRESQSSGSDRDGDEFPIDTTGPIMAQLKYVMDVASLRAEIRFREENNNEWYSTLANMYHIPRLANQQDAKGLSRSMSIASLVKHAQETELAILRSWDLSNEQFQSIADLHHKNEWFVNSHFVIEAYDRLQVLKLIENIGLDGFRFKPYESSGVPKAMFDVQDAVDSGIDINLALRHANHLVDRLTDAMMHVDPAMRQESLHELQAEFAVYNQRLDSQKMLNTRESRSKGLAEVCVAALLPPETLADAIEITSGTKARDALLRVAAAVRAYQSENDTLPQNLDELVPDYLPRIPHDQDSEKVLPTYRILESGFELSWPGNEKSEQKSLRLIGSPLNK